MIPPKIHYCWFGGGPLPRLAQSCMKTWREAMPSAEIVRWDETNYDVAQIPYVAAAARSRQWAFVSDYARLDVVLREGGVYLDIDVKLLQPLEPLLMAHRAFVGRQNDGSVNTGLILAAESGTEILRDMRDAYRSYAYKNEKGEFRSPPCTTLQTDFLTARGYLRNDPNEQRIGDLTILRAGVIASEDRNGLLLPCREALGVHYGMSSWYPLPWRLLRAAKRRLARWCTPRMLKFFVSCKRCIIRNYQR